MMDPLTAALVCAMSLTKLPIPPVLPHWEQRNLTAKETLLTNRPRNARAMYSFWATTIISPPNDWPALVHEMVHHLEYWAGIPFDEGRAEAAEARATECLDKGPARE
jgi:hypothetical protein